jgi:hypothetical protein
MSQIEWSSSRQRNPAMVVVTFTVVGALAAGAVTEFIKSGTLGGQAKHISTLLSATSTSSLTAAGDVAVRNEVTGHTYPIFMRGPVHSERGGGLIAPST